MLTSTLVLLVIVNARYSDAFPTLDAATAVGFALCLLALSETE